MTRKKSRPQHRETGNTEFEGYKMFWTSIENDDDMSDVSSDHQNRSSTVVIIDDSDSSHENDNSRDGVSVPLPIKVEIDESNRIDCTLEAVDSSEVQKVVCLQSSCLSINSVSNGLHNQCDLVENTLPLDSNPVPSPLSPQSDLSLPHLNSEQEELNNPKSSDSNEEKNCDSIHPKDSNCNGGLATREQTQSVSDSNCDLDIVSDANDDSSSTAQTASCTNDIANYLCSTKQTSIVPNGDQSSTEQTVNGSNSNLTLNEENIQVCNSISDVLNDKCTLSNILPTVEVPEAPMIIPDNTDFTNSFPCAKTTGEAFSLLKALLKSNQEMCSIVDKIPTPPSSETAESNPISPTNTTLTLDCQKSPVPIECTACQSPMHEHPPDEPSAVTHSPVSHPLVFITPKDEFPTYVPFVGSKIKLEQTQIPRVLQFMKSEIDKLCGILIKANFLPPKVDEVKNPPEDVQNLPEDAQNYDLSHKLTPCQVNLHRLPITLVEDGSTSLNNPLFKIWRKKANRVRNEGKFKDLKVWRRGRTLLWRECELLGMDRSTYDEQVAFIRDHKFESSSSESESGDDEAQDSSTVTPQVSQPPVRKPGPKSVVKGNKKIGPKTRVNPGVTKEVATVRDEYVVECNTVSADESSVEGKNPSALKITIRKASLSKSEDEKVEAETQNSAPHSNKKIKRTFVTKRTYRKTDVPPVPVEPDKLIEAEVSKKRKSRGMPDAQPFDDTSVLGCRSYEVENFNLLEKWDIPFEAPTLFRSPRVASKLAQLKNKEAFRGSYVRQPKVPKTPAVSKEVKEVVEMLCVKTIESILSPDNGDECISRVSLDSLKPLVPDTPISISQPVKAKSADLPHLQSEPSIPATDTDTDITTESEDKSSSPAKKPKKKPPMSRRKRKVKKKPKARVSAPSFTNSDNLPQVPVVSEGPGQSLCEAEDESAQSSSPSNLLISDQSSAGGVGKVESLKNTNDEKGVDCNNDALCDVPKQVIESDPIIPRVTRAKQPVIDIDPDIIENFGIRKKRKSAKESTAVSPEPQEKSHESKEPTVKPKSKGRSKKSKKQDFSVSRDKEVLTPLNTQVHEVSEGPGELDAITAQDADVIDQPKTEGSSPLGNVKTTVEPENEVAKEPPTIPDSPMSPTPDTEPLPFVRVTRSKKRISSEGSAYIVMTKKKEEPPTLDLNTTNSPELAVRDTSSVVSSAPKSSTIERVDSAQPTISSSPLRSPSHSNLVIGSPDADNLVIDCEIPLEASEKPGSSPNVGPSNTLNVPTPDPVSKSNLKPSPVGTTHNRLAVLDTLNSILATSVVTKKLNEIQPTKLVKAMNNAKEPLTKPVATEDVVFSDEEAGSNDLAHHISKIIQEQIKDDGICEKSGEQDPIKSSDSAASKLSQEPDVMKKDTTKPNDVTSAEPERDLIGKRRDSIDERTGLPTTLIQRLRDPRIRSKLLSQLESEDLNAPVVHQSPKRIVPNDCATVKPVVDPKSTAGKNLNADEPVNSKVISNVPTAKVASENVEHSSSSIQDESPSQNNPDTNIRTKSDTSDDEEENLKRRQKKPRKELDSELKYKSPLEDLQSEARPSYGRTPPGRYSRGDPRRPNVDARKTAWTSKWDRPPPRQEPVPLSALTNAPRPNEVTWPGYQEQRKISDICDANLVGSHLPWTNPWHVNQGHPDMNPFTGGGFGSSYQEPRRNFMEMKLINLARLPKTTDLNSPPIKKIFSFFNHGNPQVLAVPPPTYDPKEEARTISMFDAMGEEMIDIIQLPRPTSGLTDEYFKDLTDNLDIDCVVSDPYIALSCIVDEEVELGACGINIFEEEDEMEILKKSGYEKVESMKEEDKNSLIDSRIESPIMFDQRAIDDQPVKAKSTSDEPRSYSPKTMSSPKMMNDFDLSTDDPLANILHRLPLLKQQYCMKPSNSFNVQLNPHDKQMGSLGEELKEPPPPPKWTTNEEMPVSKSSDEIRNSPPPKKNKKSKSSRNMKSGSKSPRWDGSRSKSPRRRKSRSKSPRRRKSRSKSPRRRKSRSKSPRRRKSRSKSPRWRKSRSKSPSFRHRNKVSIRAGSRSTSRSPSRSPYMNGPKTAYGSGKTRGLNSNERPRSRERSWSISSVEHSLRRSRSPNYRRPPPFKSPRP